MFLLPLRSVRRQLCEVRRGQHATVRLGRLRHWLPLQQRRQRADHRLRRP